jgi:hypothetical protein
VPLLRVFVLALAGVAGFGLASGLPGCIQIGPSDDDGGADAAPPTVKEQCATIMSAYCGRANECFGEDPNACFPSAVEACCAKNCDKPSTSDEHAIKVCVADIGREDCDQVLNAMLPSRCNNVIKFD